MTQKCTKTVSNKPCSLPSRAQKPKGAILGPTRLTDPQDFLVNTPEQTPQQELQHMKSALARICSQQQEAK
eukprot:1946506-Amphidinium_carterae.1